MHFVWSGAGPEPGLAADAPPPLTRKGTLLGELPPLAGRGGAGGSGGSVGSGFGSAKSLIDVRVDSDSI